MSQPGSVGSSCKGGWSRSTDSNREPAAYKAAALPLRYCGTFPPAAISRQDGPCRVHGRRKVTGGQRRFLLETTDTEANRMPLALGHAAVDYAGRSVRSKNALPNFATRRDCRRLVGCSLPSRQTPWNLPQSAAPCAVDGWGTIRQIGRSLIPQDTRAVVALPQSRTSASAPTSSPAGRSPVPQT